MSIKSQTFEAYLQTFHAKLYPQILDDDLSDHFDNWLDTLQVEDFLRYGDMYGQSQHIDGRDYVLDKLTNERSSDDNEK